MKEHKLHGFSMVELLIVITITGILISLLLPAVEAAREAARQLQCKNNLKQLALGCLTHENALGYFPTGGWGYAWTGDPERGSDWHQPAGWLYTILPYIGQQGLHDMGLDKSESAKADAAMNRMSMTLSVWYCPTRRPAIVFPWDGTGEGVSLVNAGRPTAVGKSDYAANAGSGIVNGHAVCTPSVAWVSAPIGGAAGPIAETEVSATATGPATANAITTFKNAAAISDGIVWLGSTTRATDVKDGLSCTYLLGEKWIDVDHYTDGGDLGDDQGALIGQNEDILRWTGIMAVGTAMQLAGELIPDTPAYRLRLVFGSAHANGFQMGFCDGSVQMMSYSLDPQIHKCLGSRADGHVIDAKSF
jgi:prepilin-type N-terminal cleavage/methylation domain-containing protein/prepilin-type processing-associated H-X9-DG protein